PTRCGQAAWRFEAAGLGNPHPRWLESAQISKGGERIEPPCRRGVAGVASDRRNPMLLVAGLARGRPWPFPWYLGQDPRSLFVIAFVDHQMAPSGSWKR